MFTRRTGLALMKGVFTKKAPCYVQYAVTKRCNLGCKMCASSFSRRDERELTLPEIERLANTLDKMNAGIVLLTGGEPFVRDDIHKIIRIFSQKGFTVRLQTNGILAGEEEIKSAYRSGMKEVTISLDSLLPDKQDAITGEKGSWYKIIASIARFSRLLPLRRVLLGVNTVVTPQNLKEIPDIIRFVTEIGFYSSLIPVHLAPSDKEEFILRRNAPQFAFQPKDFVEIDNVYRKIINMKKEGFNIYNSFRFLNNSPVFLKYGKVDWSCDSPDLYFAISPSGKFLPCVDLKTSFSMLDEKFAGIFRSEDFKSKIKEMVKGCPGCFYACWPEITFLCRDPAVFAERLLFGLKAVFKKRTPIDYSGCLGIIENIKRNQT